MVRLRGRLLGGVRQLAVAGALTSSPALIRACNASADALPSFQVLRPGTTRALYTGMSKQYISRKEVEALVAELERIAAEHEKEGAYGEYADTMAEVRALKEALAR